MAPPTDPRLSAALARLDARVDWERRGRSRMRVSLEPERDLLERLGRPERDLSVVHVAGSKGKGSVCSMVAAGLTRAGLAAGRYCSPHVERVNERVAIAGEDVGDALLAEGLERALDARERAQAQGTPGAGATWFDLLTAAALWVFGRAGVRWLAAEVGLGGRLDSTNVLSGEVCVITTIELEHANVLGPTRAAIAAEKAGILKSGCTLVTGVRAGDEAGEVIDACAAELGVAVLRPDHLRGPLAPPIKECNAALARLVLDELGRRGHAGADGRPLSAGLLDGAALRAARLPARMEGFRVRGVPVVLDGAHTPNSARDVLRDLSGRADLPGRPVVVLGLAREKDAAGILKAVGARADRLVCTSVGSALHRTPEEIASEAAALGLAAETAATPADALGRGLELASAGGWVLVAGSLYLAGEIRPLLVQLAARPRC